MFTISDLALLQIGLVVEGFFIRGGLSVGELYIDDEVVYGAALLDAYDAEQLADVPRVVLHSTAINAVHDEVTYHARTYGERRGHRFTDAVLVDEDGIWFVNYLQQVFAAGIFEEPDFHALETHRDLIQEHLLKHVNDTRIRRKYEWVARYHNHFCTTTAGGQEYAVNINLPPLNVTAIESHISIS